MELVYGFVGNEDSGCIRCAAAPGTKQMETIIWNVRMPRTATAIAVGAALALTGCVMQNVLRNPLASASTLGVSQGASFGAAFAITMLGAGIQVNSGYRRSIDDHQSLYGKYLCVCRRDHHNHRDLNARLFYKSHTIHYDFSRSGIKLFIYRSDHPDPVFLR